MSSLIVSEGDDAPPHRNSVSRHQTDDLEGVDIMVDPAQLEGITDDDAAAVGQDHEAEHQGAAELRRLRAASGKPSNCVPFLHISD
jgi:hypothetical protein